MLSNSMNEKLNAQITREFYSSYRYRQIASCLDSMGLRVLEQFFLDQADEGRLAILEGVGFEVSADHHFSLRQNPFGWIQSALNRIPGLPRNGLYAMLHRRGHAERRVYSASQRAVFWTLSVLLAPLALLATLLESTTRSGATVHVVAFRRPESQALPAA